MYLFLEEPDDFKPIFEVTSAFCDFDWEFVLLLRQDHKWEPNMYWVPAWKIGQWESPKEALIRELKEETQLEIPDSEINFFKKVYARFPTYDFVYHMYYINFLTRPSIIINKEEHKEYLWTTPAKSLDLNLIYWLDDCIRLFYKI